MDLDRQPVLQISNAVGAILIDSEHRYLLQLRDDIPHIWYPNHWGVFGGAVESGESELDALRRELQEELQLSFTEARLFTRLHFDLRPAGLECYYRSYYEVKLDPAQATGLVLNEGAAMRSLAADEALRLQLVPYDAFALFLHHQHKRLSGPAACAPKAVLP